MKSSSDFEITLPDSFLLIGNPGTGKTTLALQLPKPFVLDCDQNLSGPVRFLKGEGKNPSFFYDTPWLDSTGKRLEKQDVFARGIELIKEACNNPDVETIIIDSLSTWVEMAMVHVLKIHKKPLGDNIKTFDAKFEFAEWGALGSLLRQTIFALKATGRRLVITAHISVDKDELTGVLYNFISCPGNTKHQLAGWFQEVWQLTSETIANKRTHKIRTVAADQRNYNLGLKSSVGLPAVVEMSVDELLKKLTK